MTARRERLEAMLAHSVIRPDRACKAKTAYPSQNDARHAAKVLGKAHDRVYDTYKCPFNVEHYHITRRRHGDEDAE